MHYGHNIKGIGSFFQLFENLQLTSTMELMKKKVLMTKVIKVIFTILCIALFFKESYDSIKAYLKYETLSKSTQERQENHPLPWICVEASKADEVKFEALNLTSDDYVKNGKWKPEVSSMDEKFVYDAVSYTLGDLIEHIEMESSSEKDSDHYELKELKLEDRTTERCDYYKRQKCNCIKIPLELAPHGVQEILLHFKQNIMHLLH